MKKLLDLENWSRKDHFHFFRKFDEPFFGVTATVDCTAAFETAKSLGVSFFVYYLHKTLRAANQVEPFRYRIEDDKIVVWNQINASPTVSREDGSFAFSLAEYHEDLIEFANATAAEIERVRVTSGLFTRSFEDDNIIHFSALPWVNFTSLSHARSYAVKDSCPKISFGKMSISENGTRTMPVSVHVHHGLMDGLHVGQFIDCLQQELNSRK
ncbi:MAG: chloramphenicol acetyltransferase [Flavobacterium sp.]|nr:MAG: chloramphenicol acetyltransferase [Flavobacterium sp.]